MRDRSHPLELLRQAAARRDQAGARRHLVAPRRRTTTGSSTWPRTTTSGCAGTSGSPRARRGRPRSGVPGQPDAAVLAVTVGESAVAVRSQKACAAYGVRVGCFRPPAVPRGQACLRLAGRASLTEDDFAAAARALAAVRGEGELLLAAAPRHSPFMLSTI